LPNLTSLKPLLFIVVFYLLAADRLPKLITGVAVAAASVLLIVGLLHRTDLRNALSTPLAVTQRHQLTLLLIAGCLGVALRVDAQNLSQ